MDNKVRQHDIRILPPYYGSDQATALHRFLEPEFMPRYLRDLQQGRLNEDWKADERFSGFDQRVVLRLPIHRSFYVVSCELACDRLGLPALDPARITSAGFVIRRQLDGRELAWMVEEDEAMGWQDCPTGPRDPDVHRRLCKSGVLHPRQNVPTYTGEMTHPLHPQVSVDRDGRKHTLLYGYLPLGGSYTPRRFASTPFEAGSLADFQQQGGAILPWPYGFRDGVSSGWQPGFSLPVHYGEPNKGFFELLRMLVYRYHLGEEDSEMNQGLAAWAQGIYFYHLSPLYHHYVALHFDDDLKAQLVDDIGFSLWDWLRSQYRNGDNELVKWLAAEELAIDKAGGLAAYAGLDTLPGRYGIGQLAESLLMTPADAQELRQLLGQRLQDQALSKIEEIPLPKFRQGRGELYQVLPFVRALDDSGKERIHWARPAQRSELFRVAAPFDPLASRPSMIQMPALRDLRKGLARGVSMITPPDTFNLLNALNLKKGASEDVVPDNEPSGIGIQWICSFSLPVITLVAMILLMIMISLLNIVFFWLPWVRICLPFPKTKE